MTERTPQELAANDQRQAASNHAAALQGRIGDSLGHREATPELVTRWHPALQAAWLRHALALSGRSARICPHIDPARPGPTVAVAWWPGWLACTLCAGAGWLPDPLPGQDFRCDACGADSGPGQGFLTGSVRDGHMLWHFGLCQRCAPDDPPSEDASP